MKRRDWVPIAVGVLLATAIAAIGWFAYSSAKRNAAESQARSEAEEERNRIEAVQERMRPVEQAVKRYYTEHFEWPPNNNLVAVAPYLEQGQQGLIDPWGNPYGLE